ncbi:hypothetical protein [Streptomyces alboniger]|uniref:Uncharacterized protein n=1 Tax=Streptomyces alboniger TaxID=132473 RepID=A0A5J6H8F8_STRAD|nr:hypothetical protein [Streptomyces alboniger]QEV16309.1 hypothetical protein CP975_01215 [Streptomyces alboniger]
MIAVAVLLLPGLALLLFVTVRLEDGLFDPKGQASSARHARHARRHHLRLIPGGGAGAPASSRGHRFLRDRDAA